MCGYLVTDVPQILHVSVIRVLMTDVKSTSYGTAVRILSVVCEYFCNDIHKKRNSCKVIRLSALMHKCVYHVKII